MTTTSPYACLVWKIGDRLPQRVPGATAIEVLTTGVEHLKAGFQVRLTDAAVQWFANRPQPDGQFAAAAAELGQAAALTGPPQMVLLPPDIPQPREDDQP